MAQQGLCILVPWSIVEREREREERVETKGRPIIEESARGIFGTLQKKLNFKDPSLHLIKCLKNGNPYPIDYEVT